MRIDPSPGSLSKIAGGLGKDLSNYRPAWRLIAPIIAAGIARNIQSRGGALGETWPRENRNYQRRKAREGKGRVELVVSGKLLADMTTLAGIQSMTAKRLVFGTKQKYARAVNFGFATDRGKTQIRPRKFAGWNDSMKQEAGEVLDLFVRELLVAASDRLKNVARMADGE